VTLLEVGFSLGILIVAYKYVCLIVVVEYTTVTLLCVHLFETFQEHDRLLISYVC